MDIIAVKISVVLRRKYKNQHNFLKLTLLQDERRLLSQNEAFEQIRKNSARGKAMDDK